MGTTVLGLPVPANLEDMTLEEIHALHAKFGEERTQLKLKQMSIMPALQAKQQIKDLATRAGFDTVLGMGPGLDEQALLNKLAAKLGFTVTKGDK